MTDTVQAKTMGRPSPARVWFLAIRPKTLWAGAVPVGVAAALAASHVQINIWPVLAALLGSLLIQVGTNLVNDFADFKKGADGPDRLGPARATAQGWLEPGQVLFGAALSLGLAGVLGIYIIWIGGWPLAVLGVLSLVCAVAYTAGPLPLAYVGLGDLFVLLFFGGGAVCGTYYLLCQTLAPFVLIAAFALGALATAILVVNNLRDELTDTGANKRTLVVRFGQRFGRWEYLLLIGSAYLSVILGIVVGWAPHGWFCSLLTLPLALVLIRGVWMAERAELNPYLGRTGALEMAFGVTLAVGSFL